MADFEAIAKKYGYDSNWNALRGQSDPLFAGLDPNANWNSFRPQHPAGGGSGGGGGTTQPGSFPSPGPYGSDSPPYLPGYQFPDNFPEGFHFPYQTMGDQRSPDVFDYPQGYGSEGNPYPFSAGGQSYDDWVKSVMDSGVSEEEARANADIIFGQNGRAPTQNPYAGTPQSGNNFSNPGGSDIDAIIRRGFQMSQGRDPSDSDYAYWRGKWPELIARGQQLGDPDYAWKRLIGMGAGPQDASRYGPYAGGDPNAERIGASAPQSNGYAATTAYNPFDDPATKPFIDMLNQRIAALQQPHTNPDLTALQDYMRQYFERLQGPAYTDQERDLLQTQSLDPLERQRGAARNQVLQRLSARGIAPSSGIAEKALQDVDRQFNELRTKTQAGFAQKEIDLNRINAQQAAGVGQVLANLDQTQFANQEGRADQALNYAQIIPNLARQRFQDAASLLSQNTVNPASLINQQLYANNLSDQNQAQWIQGMFSILPYLLQMFR